MQTLTDIRIYTNALRYKGEDITAIGVHREGDNIIIRTSDGSVVEIRVPMGVCECEVQPMPEAVSACAGGSATNVLGSVLAGTMLLDEDVMEQLGRIPELEEMIGTHNKEVRFFCIEPVVVKVGDVEYHCEANQVATVFVGDEDFEIIPTSNRSIQSLLGYPIPLKWHDWLEGVEVFDGIVFDMNELETYHHWIQYYQDEFHVQKAQYANCVFWSDKPYTHSPFEERTNYTLYYSSQLPLCYSRIPENTYKPFYLAYGVTSDPNWRNPDYINSYANVSGATQTFSYYGATAIGIFDMAVHIITLPKDCRGLMYHAPAITHAGVFDAKNTTNFGAKKGSWQEAFGDCISLTSLYIQNLKTNINISWSPINVDSMEFIINNAANTSKITIYVSPYTYYRLPESLKATATAKNIVISLLEGNYFEDNRWKTKQDVISDLESIREGAAKGATALQKHQLLKTINGESLIGEGDIIIQGGSNEDYALAPYPIKSFDLQMLTDTSGEVEVIRADRYDNLISDAIREGRRVLLAVGHTANGYEGWVDTNAYQEDLIYLDFYHMGYLYHIEIGNPTAMYTKQYISDYVRDVAATVVEESMPTAIATATQRKTMVAGASLMSMQPNILYDWSGSTLDNIALPALRSGDATYDNKWMVRLSLLSSANLTIPFEVKWKDGRAPSWSSWCICDITFSKDAGGMYTLGEWKVYK